MTLSSQKKIVVGIAVLVTGFLCGLPILLAEQSLGNDYKGIPFLYLNNEDYYLSRIQEITDGHPSVSSPVYFEYKDNPAIVPAVGEFLYIGLAKVLGISLVSAVVAAKFIFPAILFLLVYLLVSSLVEDSVFEDRGKWVPTLAGLSAGFLVVLGYDFVDVHHTLQVLTDTWGSPTLSVWTRPVNPITGALFLFGFLNVLWRLFKKPDLKKAILGGVLLALSIGYFFAWGLGVCILAILGVCAFFQKEWKVLSAFGITLLTMLVSDSYFLLAMFRGGGRAALNGMLYFHTPIFNKVVFATALLFAIGLWVLYRKGAWKKGKEEQWAVFCATLIFSSVAVFNEQIFTGRTVWPAHFVQYTIPLSFVVLVVVCFRVLHRKKIACYLVSGFIILTTLLCGVRSVESYRYDLAHYKMMQNYAPVLQWLAKNAARDCVVLVDEPREELMRLVPAFTSCNVYISGYLTAGVPDERLYQMLLIKMRLAGVSLADAPKYLAAHEQDVREFFYTDWLDLFASHPSPYTDLHIQELLKRYQTFFRADFGKELARYKIDYFVTTRLFDIRTLSMLHPQKVYEFKNLTVYDVRLR